MFKPALLLVTLSLLLAACGESPAPVDARPEPQRPVVVTSNYPLFYFAERIAGGAVEVVFPDIAGDPAQWTPGGQNVDRMQRAERVFVNGAGYEGWLGFVTLPEGRLVDTTVDVTDQLLPVTETVVHQHGPEGEHSHAGTAFTTWLDPTLAAAQSRVIAHALSELLPAERDRFQANLAELELQLWDLDRAFEQAFAALVDQPVIFSHPVYQYLQARYGINGRSVHWEPDVEPATRDWIDLQSLRREHPAQVLIWEAQPLDATEQRLGESGIRSVVFDPAGNRPGSGDYFDVMRANLGRVQVLGQANGLGGRPE